MNEVTITVTREEAAKVLAFLDTSAESISEPTSNDTTPKDSLLTEDIKELVEPVIKPSGKYKIKMPGFGRSKEEIVAHNNNEEAKAATREEESLLKAEKQETKDKATLESSKEVEAIKKPIQPEVKVVKKPF